MLSQKDLDEIEKLIDEKFDEKLKFLPNKDDFYNKMDEVIGELKAIREEHTVLGGRQSDHSDTLEDHEVRITKLEDVSE